MKESSLDKVHKCLLKMTDDEVFKATSSLSKDLTSFLKNNSDLSVVLPKESCSPKETVLVSGMKIKIGGKIRFKNTNPFIEEMCQLYIKGTNDVSERRIETGDVGTVIKHPGTYMGRPLIVIEIDGYETDYLWVYEELYDLKEHMEVIDESY